MAQGPPHLPPHCSVTRSFSQLKMQPAERAAALGGTKHTP